MPTNMVELETLRRKKAEGDAGEYSKWLIRLLYEQEEVDVIHKFNIEYLEGLELKHQSDLKQLQKELKDKCVFWNDTKELPQIRKDIDSIFVNFISQSKGDKNG